MCDPVTAIIGSQVAGSLLGADAAQSAADTQSAAADRAAATQLQMFNTVNDQAKPYREAGYTAVKDLLGGLGLGPQQTTQGGYFSKQFTNQDLNSYLAPNYQFMLDQGLGATRNAANMQSGLVSGNAMKAANDYAQNYAGNAYQNAFKNFTDQQTNIFNRLSSIAGYGQTANQSTGTAATAAGQGIGNAQMAAGAAQAAGTVGATNAITGGATNAASWFALPQILNGGITQTPAPSVQSPSTIGGQNWGD